MAMAAVGDAGGADHGVTSHACAGLAVQLSVLLFLGVSTGVGAWHKHWNTEAK